MTIVLLIGLITGLVSAALFASASTGTVLGLFVLLFLSPLPVAIAGLGWGWVAAAVATAAGVLCVAIVGSGRAAMFYGLSLGAPTAVLAYLLLLARPVGDPRSQDPASPSLEWYPIGRVVVIAAVWAGVLAGLAVLTIATDVEGLRTELQGAVERMIGVGLPVPAGTPPDQRLGEAEIKALTDLMVVTMPSVIASAWMALATINLWLAGHVTRASGRLVRPWPDLSAIAVPRGLPLLFAGAIAATFLPGMAGLLASGFASGVFFVYLLVGLAILHNVTRGLVLRPLLLTLIYFALLFLNPISGVLVAMIGIAEPLSPLKRKPPQPPQST